MVTTPRRERWAAAERQMGICVRVHSREEEVGMRPRRRRRSTTRRAHRSNSKHRITRVTRSSSKEDGAARLPRDSTAKVHRTGRRIRLTVVAHTINTAKDLLRSREVGGDSRLLDTMGVGRHHLGHRALTDMGRVRPKVRLEDTDLEGRARLGRPVGFPVVGMDLEEVSSSRLDGVMVLDIEGRRRVGI